MDHPSLNNSAKRGSVAKLVCRILACAIMLLIGVALSFLTHYFFHRGGAVLGFPAAGALVSAVLFAFGKDRTVLTVGALVATFTLLGCVTLVFGL